MKNYYKQAKALREKVAQLDELATNPRYSHDESDVLAANELWCEHVRLLKKVYPKPNPRDHIQVTVLDMYRDDAFVITTSFSNLAEFNKANNQLTWDYDLVSEQVGQCECCDEYYLIKDGCEDKEGRGFCKPGCRDEDEFETRFDADQPPDDEWYDYYFPDGDPHDREKPWW